jgi:hypothetical protein
MCEVAVRLVALGPFHMGFQVPSPTDTGGPNDFTFGLHGYREFFGHQNSWCLVSQTLFTKEPKLDA